jgi:hypothetical protein
MKFFSPSCFTSIAVIKVKGLQAGGVFAAGSVFAALFVVASYLAVFGHGGDFHPRIASEPSQSGEVFDNFKIEGFSIVEREGGRVLFGLSADRVIHRKRVSDLFVYQNMKEICFTGLKVDIHPRKGSAEAMPFADIGRSLAYLGKQPTSAEEYMEGLAGDDLDFLTRVLAEEMHINIYGPGGRKTTLEAGKARIGLELENMVFEDGVRVVSGRNGEMFAPVAVWSRRHRGLLFPEGYSGGGVSHEGRAFFVFGPEGALRRQAVAPEIDCSDPLEEKEKAFYTALQNQMPRQLRFFLGLRGHR